MGGARMAVYALLLLAALVLVDWRFQASEGAGAQDAMLVYCLQPDHQDSLVNAAVSLGLAGAGSATDEMLIAGRRLTLADWRTTDNAAFQRACDALATASMPAQPSSNGGVGTAQLLGILLPVIAGSLLTMAADDFKQVSDRRWAQADELRADWKAFEQAVLRMSSSAERPRQQAFLRPPR